MFHWIDVVRQDRGPALPNWQIECVEAADGETVVPIFADENSTPISSVSGITNRTLSDAAGNYDFFVEDGKYSLRFYNEAGVFQGQERLLSMYGNESDELDAAVAAAETAKADAETAAAALTGPNSAALISFTDNRTLDTKITATADTVAKLKAETAQSVILTGENGGLFIRDTGNGPYVADDVHVFKADDADLSAAAYVRKPAFPVNDSGDGKFAGFDIAHGFVKVPLTNPPAEGAAFVEDANHQHAGFSSVRLQAQGETHEGTIYPSFSNGGGYANTYMAYHLDDTHARAGVNLGVKGDQGRGFFVFGARPLNFSLNLETLAVTAHPYFDSPITPISATATDGQIVITHPNAGWNGSPSKLTAIDHGFEMVVIAEDSTSITLQMTCQLSGWLRGQGTAENYFGPCQEEPTWTLDGATGTVTCVYNQTILGVSTNRTNTVIVQNRAAGVYIDSYAATNSPRGFTAVLKNRSDDSFVSAVASVQLGFSVDAKVASSERPNSGVKIEKGFAFFDWAATQNDNASVTVMGFAPYKATA